MKFIIYNLFKKLNLVYQTQLKNYNHKHHNKHKYKRNDKSIRILKNLLNGIYHLQSSDDH